MKISDGNYCLLPVEVSSAYNQFTLKTINTAKSIYIVTFYIYAYRNVIVRTNQTLDVFK